MKLTKKRLAALNTALSVDDILYERFRRLHADLDKKWAKFNLAKTVIEVEEQKADGLYCMKIQRIDRTPHGMRVIVTR